MKRIWKCGRCGFTTQLGNPWSSANVSRHIHSKACRSAAKRRREVAK